MSKKPVTVRTIDAAIDLLQDAGVLLRYREEQDMSTVQAEIYADREDYCEADYVAGMAAMAQNKVAARLLEHISTKVETVDGRTFASATACIIDPAKWKELHGIKTDAPKTTSIVREP